MFLPSLTSWKSHYGRMRRSYERICEPYMSAVAYEDDLIHFFQDCWHLKDWIKNDLSISNRRLIVTDAEANNALKIVAALANASKHLVLDRPFVNKVGQAYAISNDVTVFLGQKKPIDINYTIQLFDGSTASEKEVVRQSYEAWESILTQYNLIPI